MGLFKAGIGAFSGALADQWREYFYCESLDTDTLITKGVKRTSSRSSNTKGTDNVISNGSIVCVADGQCMIIVAQGKVVEFCAEPGEFVYDSGSGEATIMYGGLNKENIKKNLGIIGERFTFGGDVAKDQRVYYVNIREIYDNTFGTTSPIPFHIQQNQAPYINTTVDVRMNGTYAYKITDPVAFYKLVAGNVSSTFDRETLHDPMRSELLAALQPSLAAIGKKGIMYDELPAYTLDLGEELKGKLLDKWLGRRGIELIEINIANVTVSDEDAAQIKELTRTASIADPSMRDAYIARGVKEGFSNIGKGDGMGGVMGIGMMGNMMSGGMFSTNASNTTWQNPTQQQPQAAPATPAADSWTCSCGTVNQGKFCSGCGTPKPAPVAPAGGWTCACGTQNTGKFCINCGNPKPEEQQGWTCACGTVNQGKFCMNCGTPKPAAAPLYKCDKCGWTPDDPKNPPKFCPVCGDKFDENDVQ